MGSDDGGTAPFGAVLGRALAERERVPIWLTGQVGGDARRGQGR
jgi:hypothetical protein